MIKKFDDLLNRDSLIFVFFSCENRRIGVQLVTIKERNISVASSAFEKVSINLSDLSDEEDTQTFWFFCYVL